MGLDMYLKASKYLAGGWSHATDAEKSVHRRVCRAIDITKKSLCEHSGGMEVSWTIAYWRKVNAIHKWFVDNVQDGRDECQLSQVSRSQLEILRNTCRNALALKKEGTNPHLAAAALPPQSGFFFGSTEIDEWYWQDIENTVKQLTAVLTNPELKDCDFYYQASW